jgi:hypothetical protein
MLPIYQAQSFNKILDGGTTKPWLVIVQVAGKPVPYVVKLYKKKDIDHGQSVAKDVYCSALASIFALSVPTPALIEFTPQFIATLPEPIKTELGQKDSRIKFGTEFIDGSYQYIETLHRDSLKKYDCQTIYAFDNLILNADRRVQKSNILLRGTSVYLIDHELTLFVNQHHIEEFKKNNFIYWKERHIFYNFLKSGNVEDKRRYFEGFHASLLQADFNILDKYNQQMVSLGHDTEHNYLTIKDYLCTLKSNSTRLIDILKGGIG